MTAEPVAGRLDSGMRAACSELQQACRANPAWVRANHALLFAGLWRQCAGERPLQDPIDLLKQVERGRPQKKKLDCRARPAELFAPLAAGGPAVVLQACSICQMLRADRAAIRQKFVLWSFSTLNPAVDKGSKAYVNFGALSGGYDHFCHSSTRRRAHAKGCALVYELAAHCPEKSLRDVIAFLDDPHLLGFFVSQDVFLFREDGEARLHPHRKVVPVPIGVNFRDYSRWAPGGPSFSLLRGVAANATLARTTLVVARDSQAFQRQVVHRQVGNTFGAAFDKGNDKSKGRDVYIKSLAASKFIISPPGWGSDCYRHWEALLVGTIPVVKRTSVSMIGGLDYAPVVVVDDYSAVTAAGLEAVWAEVTRASPQALLKAVAPLFQEFWVGHLASMLADGADVPHELKQGPFEFELPGVVCGNNTFDAVAATLENARKQYPLQFAANPQQLGPGQSREYCECPCQCGLCASDALSRTWGTLDGIGGYAKAKGSTQKLLDVVRQTGHRRKGDEKGGDKYHAYRCLLADEEAPAAWPAEQCRRDAPAPVHAHAQGGGGA